MQFSCWARANPPHQSSFGVAVPEPELIHPTRAAGPAETRVYPSLSPALPQSQTPVSVHPGTPCAERLVRRHTCRDWAQEGKWWLHRDLPSPWKSQSCWWHSPPSTAPEWDALLLLTALTGALALAPGWHSPAAAVAACGDKQPGSASVLPTFPAWSVQKTLSLWVAVRIRPKESSALMSSATVSLCGFFRAAAKSVQCCFNCLIW